MIRGHKSSNVREVTIVRVHTAPGRRARGMVRLGPAVWPCALGRGGLVARKREGDGGTPLGRLRIREVLYRPDRVKRPRTGLPTRALRANDGWCDAPGDRSYNRPVRLPYPASAESLWRSDHLYDVVAVLGYNDHPRISGRGSAIFMHVARPSYAPTEGCVALTRKALLELLSRCDRGSVVEIVA